MSPCWACSASSSFCLAELVDVRLVEVDLHRVERLQKGLEAPLGDLVVQGVAQQVLLLQQGGHGQRNLAVVRGGGGKVGPDGRHATGKQHRQQNPAGHDPAPRSMSQVHHFDKPQPIDWSSNPGNGTMEPTPPPPKTRLRSTTPADGRQLALTNLSYRQTPAETRSARITHRAAGSWVVGVGPWVFGLDFPVVCILQFTFCILPFRPYLP